MFILLIVFIVFIISIVFIVFIVFVVFIVLIPCIVFTVFIVLVVLCKSPKRTKLKKKPRAGETSTWNRLGPNLGVLKTILGKGTQQVLDDFGTIYWPPLQFV